MRREDVIEWKLQNDVKRRLCGIADSFQRLSGSISSFQKDGKQAECDAIENLFAETASGICEHCSNCTQCYEEGSRRREQIASFLDAFRKKGSCTEEIRAGYLTDCKHRYEIFSELDRGICELRRGLLWRNRLDESREAVADQLTEMARIVGEFAGDLEQKGGKVWLVSKTVFARLRLHHIKAKRILLLEREDGCMELHMTARCTGGRCITTKEAAYILGCLLGIRFTPCSESKNIIGREYSDYVFREEALFQVVTGVARATRADSAVSGDNFSFLYPEGDTCIMMLSDGMGSGEQACLESERVIDLLEDFLAAGFREDAAMKLINSMLFLRPDSSMISTMDVCVIHLTTGLCDFRKAGAAATYILRGDWMESIRSATLPVGLLSTVSYETKQKKLFDGDYIIMLSDGVLEGMTEGESYLAQVLRGIESKNPQEIADRILENALMREDYQPQDDMTVMVAGVFQRKL